MATENPAPEQAPAETAPANAAPAAPADRANDPEVVAWAVGKGLRTVGGVDAGHVQAYDDEKQRLDELSRS